MSEIKLKSIIKNFGGNSIAVDNLSEIFPDGEFVCLLGPSGSGKTTTLRMIAGLETPDSGEIFYGDKTFFSSKTGELTKTENRNLGLMFQSYALWPHMTVRDNIGFGLRERKFATSNIQQKTNEVLELVNLSHLADRMPNQLSGGQQQRIALARTLVVEPDVLLLDEPLSNLDASLRVQMRRELLLLQRKLGLTTIFVTHDQEEANTTCDRMAVLENGIIQQIGSPQELYDNPTNLFVAKFLGTANILTGSIETNGRNTRFVTTTGETLNLPTAAQSGTQLVLRPQNIEIQKTSGKGTLKARVIHREFLGSQIRYLVNAAGTELVVDHSHTPDGVWFENGTNIHLRPNTSGATVL